MKRPFTLTLRRPLTTKCLVSPISDGMSVLYIYINPAQEQEVVLVTAVRLSSALTFCFWSAIQLLSHQMQLPKTWLILISRTISILEFSLLKFFWLLAKHWSCHHDHWTKSWVQLFPYATCVIKSNLLLYIPWILVSFHALRSWAFSNPSQSPMLAHCSVHEWVIAGSERWKVYWGVDPDTAHCYWSV